MRDVLVVSPQERDFQAIRESGLDRSFRIRFAGPDLDRASWFAPRTFLAACKRIPADGVVGTKDRSALLAALVAEQRRLPGPRPAALLACQHKPTSRNRQLAVVPEATPRFAVLDGRSPAFGPPFFVKPVVGRLSQLARRVENIRDLPVDADDPYADGWAAIASLAGFPLPAAHGFLAEELLDGDEVTLEGYVHQGRVTTIGITDSLKYAGTGSFEAFVYPSAASSERQRELSGVAARLLPALGFDGGFFNVEFFVPKSGPAKIVEVNGRIASQFTPLLEAAHGRSSYDALLALACGDDPEWKATPPEKVAVSYALRTFEDAFVSDVPDPEEDVELLVRPGRTLSRQRAANDVASYRLAILYETGATRDEALARARARAAGLSFRLEPAPAR